MQEGENNFDLFFFDILVLCFVLTKVRFSISQLINLVVTQGKRDLIYP